ncbi:MAG: chromate transporter, partial [Alistipes sp.]|nr:chromate transporter [Alistipes sp.]
MISLWQIFSVFAKIGAFTIGGGAAMIPQMQQIVVDEKRWLTDD